MSLTTDEEAVLVRCVLDVFTVDSHSTADAILCNLIDADLVHAYRAPYALAVWKDIGDADYAVKMYREWTEEHWMP